MAAGTTTPDPAPVKVPPGVGERAAEDAPSRAAPGPTRGAADRLDPTRPDVTRREGAGPRDHDLLRQFLHGRDVACPGCGYNLRDLAGDRCPECGQVIVLQPHLAEPRQAALLTGLIGLAAGAGLNGLLLVYYAIMIATMPFGGPPDNHFLWTILIGFVVHAAAVAAWLRFWRRIRRAPAARRWGLAAACCAMPLVDIVIFSLNIR